MNNNKAWFQEHDIAVKLQHAIENLSNGQALHLAFAGLEKGSVSVNVVYNGENIVFAAKTPRGNVAEMPCVDVAVAVDPADLPEDPVLVSVAKTKRKKHIEESEASAKNTVEISSEA